MSLILRAPALDTTASELLRNDSHKFHQQDLRLLNNLPCVQLCSLDFSYHLQTNTWYCEIWPFSLELQWGMLLTMKHLKWMQRILSHTIHLFDGVKLALTRLALCPHMNILPQYHTPQVIHASRLCAAEPHYRQIPAIARISSSGQHNWQSYIPWLLDARLTALECNRHWALGLVGLKCRDQIV